MRRKVNVTGEKLYAIQRDKSIRAEIKGHVYIRIGLIQKGIDFG